MTEFEKGAMLSSATVKQYRQYISLIGLREIINISKSAKMVLTHMDLSNQAILEVTKGIYKEALAMKTEEVRIVKA